MLVACQLGNFPRSFPRLAQPWLPTHFRAACVLFPDISGHLGTALGRLLSATRYASVVVVESSACVESSAWVPYSGCTLVLEALPGRQHLACWLTRRVARDVSVHSRHWSYQGVLVGVLKIWPVLVVVISAGSGTCMRPTHYVHV